jgi:alpha-1,3-rhamnosyl/mannosyltransferase
LTRAPHLLVSGVVLGQPIGGVVRHNQELLPRLARLLTDHGGSLTVLEGRPPITFPLPPPIARIPSDVPAQPVMSRALSESRALRRTLRTARTTDTAFDLVHTAHLPAPRGLDVPFTLTIHDLRALSNLEALVVRRLVARRVIESALQRARLVFTVSATIAAEITSLFPETSAKLRVVPNGADHFTPLPRNPAHDAPIVCLGHLEPRKNLDLVLRALAHDPTLPHLEIHGAPKNDEGERLRALAVSLRIEPRVRFAGPFTDEALPAILARAACVCLPSTIEGFGIVALEAQRARSPLAIARAGALPEVAGADVPSFEPDDVSACARALHAALATGSEALERAAVRADGFTWDAAANSWFRAVSEAD